MNPTVLEFFALPKADRSHWISEIGRSDWKAGAYLHGLLSQGRMRSVCGQDPRLYLLTGGEDLLAFCTLCRQDEIEDDTLLPWIGFVYTFPAHRGKRYSRLLIDHACAQAKKLGHDRVYISSNEIGLYEKYGFRLIGHRQTRWQETTQVFVREL